MLKVFRRPEGRGWESAPAFLLGEVQQWRLGAAPAVEAGHVLGGAMLDSCLGVSET